MDTSKEYIKMCEKAVEIQKRPPFRFTEGSFLYDGNKVNVVGMDYIGIESFEPRPYFYFATLKRGFDFVIDEYSVPDVAIVDHKKWEYEVKRLANPTWLPRQDQLQGMIYLFKEDGEGARCLAYQFSKFLEDSDIEYLYTIEGSLEQLWLAFVMKERFNKIWDGEDWKGGNR